MLLLKEPVLTIMNTIEKAGFEVYIVGGALRDMLLGKTPHDLDIASGALPSEIKKIFPKTIDTGLKHGTVSVYLDEQNIFEVTTFRKEHEYKDFRRPEKVDFIRDIQTDLKRRDFTINAMAYSPKTGLIDLFGGEKDLKEGIIRCVGNANERFLEDALRMLRAVRFSCTLGFEIDQEAKNAIKKNAHWIKKVSKERILSELNQALSGGFLHHFVSLYETGLSAHILPWLDECFNTPQNTKYHKYCVGEHLLNTLQAVDGGICVKWAALLHDVGKKDVRTTDIQGVDHFKGHGKKSVEIARTILSSLGVDNKSRKYILRLIQEHNWHGELSPEGVRRAVARAGKDLFADLILLMKADAAAHSEKAAKTRLTQIDYIENEFEKILQNNWPVNINDLKMNGCLLKGIGFEGREIGKTLDWLLDLVLKNPEFNQEQILIKKAKERRVLDARQ